MALDCVCFAIYSHRYAFCKDSPKPICNFKDNYANGQTDMTFLLCVILYAFMRRICRSTNTNSEAGLHGNRYFPHCEQEVTEMHMSMCPHQHAHTHNITFWLAQFYVTIFTTHCIMENCTEFD
jgi:hypothetical protein